MNCDEQTRVCFVLINVTISCQTSGLCVKLSSSSSSYKYFKFNMNLSTWRQPDTEPEEFWELNSKSQKDKKKSFSVTQSVDQWFLDIFWTTWVAGKWKESVNQSKWRIQKLWAVCIQLVSSVKKLNWKSAAHTKSKTWLTLNISLHLWTHKGFLQLPKEPSSADTEGISCS